MEFCSCRSACTGGDSGGERPSFGQSDEAVLQSVVCGGGAGVDGRCRYI